MLQLRSRDEIAGADAGWLKAKHHFAIGPYGNPAHRPVGSLIVLNDDEIDPHSGFGLHPHADMEIVTYVYEGAITHRDDQGNAGVIHAGEVQAMSAGTGIRHSERNDQDSRTRLFQIWITPTVPGGVPRWGTKPFPRADRAGRIVPLASGRNQQGALPIRADAEVSGAMLPAGSETRYAFAKGDAGYLVVASGELEVNGVRVLAREGLVIENEAQIVIKAQSDSEILLVVSAS